MATVTKSIGTSSRDYSTITAWEADLDDTNIYTSGDDAVGECYNDSTFSTNNVIINGGSTVGLSSITLGVATGERHDGTAGTGAILEKDSLWNNLLSISTTVETLVTDLEISSTYVTANGVIAVGAYRYDHRFSKLLIYASAGANGAIGAGFWRVVVDNCIMYGAINGGIGANTYYSPCEFVNNTIYCPNPISNPSDSTTSKAIIKNNIAFSTNTTNSINSTGATSHPDWQNNLVNVGPNYGSNQYTETSSSKLFVSTVSGSEDLHLNSTSTAIGKGANLSSQLGLSTYHTHPEYVAGFIDLDIDGRTRTALNGSWDIGADQYAITASIGTTSRDYSTITAWEADLDDTTIYVNGDNATGECYNDSTFVEGFIIDGGSTVGLNSILLIPATGERHDGTADTGVKVETLSYGTGSQYRLITTTPTLELRYIEIERNVNSEQAVVTLTNNNVFNAGILRQSTGSPTRDFVNMAFSTGYLYNSILYGVNGKGVHTQCLYGATPEIINNTIIAQSSYCLYARDKANGQANAKIKNNILIANGTAVAVDPGGTVPTSFPDYANNITNYSSFPNGLANLSDHETGISTSRQFVSTVSGSEDYHLKFLSDAIDAGEDIVATKSSTTNSYYLENTQYDINGKDRDAENSIWDIGAHEFGDNVVYGLFTVL